MAAAGEHPFCDGRSGVGLTGAGRLPGCLGGGSEGNRAPAWEALVSSALTPVPGSRPVPAVLPRPCAQPPPSPRPQAGFLVPSRPLPSPPGWVSGPQPRFGSGPRFLRPRWQLPAPMRPWVRKIRSFNFRHGFPPCPSCCRSTVPFLPREKRARTRGLQGYPVPWVLPWHRESRGRHTGPRARSFWAQALSCGAPRERRAVPALQRGAKGRGEAELPARLWCSKAPATAITPPRRAGPGAAGCLRSERVLRKSRYRFKSEKQRFYSVSSCQGNVPALAARCLERQNSY